MGDVRNEFPTRAQLWQGAILGTIAHAIWVASHPILVGLQGWDGPNYLFKDGSGDCGAITFTPEHAVGVFFDLHSRRSPLRDEPEPPFASEYHTMDYFTGAPDAIQALALQEALMYVFDNYQGQAQPVITAACWSEGDTLTAREPWSDVCAHGGHLFEIQAMPPEQAIAAWTEDYRFDEEQVVLLRSLFTRRMASADSIAVEADERRMLTRQGDAGLAESRQLLAAIGIELP
jgi:hypothetical protein